MNSRIVNVLVVLATCVAVYLFRTKFERLTGQDRLRVALSGAHKFLPPGSQIVLRWHIPEGEMGPSFVNYFLAPVKLKAATNTGNDTTLLLLFTGISDTTTTNYINRHKVIWQNKDDKFTYILIRD